MTAPPGSSSGSETRLDYQSPQDEQRDREAGDRIVRWIGAAILVAAIVAGAVTIASAVFTIVR